VPRSERLLLAAVIALGAALRFTRIGHQSFWLDESFTVDLVQRPFGDMLSGVASTESTPPLYYVLAWLWEKVFGHGEAGLRSLSALFGTLAVPVAWRAAREWFDSPRAGLVAAALVAVNPFFVWYSQEARSYSLLVLMAALSLLFLARRSYGWWALSAALALLAHYFAIFLIVPEAAWLLWSARERGARLATAAVAGVGVALVPLALHQRDLGHTSFIADISLRNRLTDLPKKLVTGELGSPTPLIGPLAGLIAVAAVGYALYRYRPPALVLVGLAAAGFLVPVVLALGGADYLLPRNVIALYVPIVLVAAAGLAGRLGFAGALVICAVAVVVNVEVATDVKLQRDDWRGAARALGRAPETRVVVVTPEYAKKPLRLYAGSLPPLPAGGADVREVDVIVYGRPPKDPAPPPGFAEVSRTRTPSYVLVRYRAPAPRHFTTQPALIQKGPTQ
jgi:mannosyltransferase